MFVGSKTWHGRKKGKVRSKHFRKTRKKSKRRKVWVKVLFRERKNKGLYHQALQSMRVSDRENNLRFMIT